MARILIWFGWTFVYASLLCAQTRNDVYIHLSTGDSLDATYYVPPTLPPPKGYPSILFIHGYGFDKYAVIASCSTYSLSGYVTICYSVRGHGNSSGGSTIMSTRERADLGEVLTYLRSLPNIDTASVGVTGGSQGGLHGLWVATDRLPVKAITTDVIVPHWASDMLANGSIRRTLLLLLQSSLVHYDSVHTKLWNYVRTDNFDSLYAQFPAGRDLDTAQLNSSTIPISQLLKWQDHYFAAEDGIDAFQRYRGPKKIYIGSRGHFSDQVESERVYQYDQVTRWFDYYLRGVQNGITTDPIYTYAYSSLPMDTAGFFQWTRVGTNYWPPAGIQLYKCYFHKDSTFSYSPQTGIGDSLVLNNDYLNPAYTFDTAYVEGFRGVRFNAIVPKHTVVFDSPPLANNVQWVGVPRMKIFARSDHETFPLHAQVYEVDSAGNRYFVNRINFTARHWQAGSEGVVDVEGTPHAHTFKQGNRIHIELTNIDVTNRQLLGSYPFVVPLLAQTSVIMFMDAGHQSYIELPLIGEPTEVQYDGNTLPKTTELLQNYPNPFNPKTNFGFRIGDFGFVSLKIFDILGREVVTLINEQKRPGIYTAEWNAVGFPSGIYFYRLQTRNFTDVKKMLLLK